MAMSAFSKAGINLVERFDTSVAELELRYANNRLIGDEAAENGFRLIPAGSIPGSDYHLVGGITELNYNIRSVGGEAFVGDTDANKRNKVYTTPRNRSTLGSDNFFITRIVQ